MYEIARAAMWTKFEQTTGRNRHEFPSADEKLNALIGDLFQPPDEAEALSTARLMYRELVRSTMTFITTAMDRRRRFLDSRQGHVRPRECSTPDIILWSFLLPRNQTSC